MAEQLSGTKALFISTNYGIEQDELVVPLNSLRDQGVKATVAAVKDAPIETLVGDKDPGDTLTPDTTLGSVSVDDFDILVIPGGTINADSLRTEKDAVELVKAFKAAGKPIAAICHGPWLFAEADVARGKRLTSFPSLQTDLRNAGADWADEEVRVCDHEGFVTITSRDPDDLDAFVGAVSKVLAGSTEPVNA